MILKLLLPILLMFLNIGEKAPNFEFLHEKGEIQHLSEYEGEVVFISFWASWCKPCLANFQEYNELRRELRKKGVVLLNVSLDKDENQWKKALMSYSFLNGENVHVTDIRSVMDSYELSFIPEYRILNKAHEFVSLPQNKGRDVLASFDGWLKE